MKHIYIITLIFIVPSLFAQNSKSEFMSNKNGDFENAITGWDKGNSTHQISIASNTDHVAPTGSTKSAEITLLNTEGSLAVIKHTTQITNLDLQHIKFNIWVKAAAPNTTIRFRLDKTGYPKSRPFTFLDTNWHKIVLTQYDAQPNSQSGIQIIGDDTTTPGAVFYIDDITASDGVLDSDFEIGAFGKFGGATLPIQVPVTQDPSSNAIQHTWTASKIWTSQTHGTSGGGNGQNNVETYEYSSDEKAQGNRSLKVVTKSGAGDNALGIVQTRTNNTWHFRYKANTDQTVGGSDGTDNNGTVLYDKIQYTISYKIMSTSNAKHTANIKVNGTDNFVGVHNLVANQWKTITKTKVIDRSTLTPAKHTYPIFRFNSPAATYYIDDFQITWQETNDAILSFEEGEMEPLNIYPNPVEDFLVINNIFDRPQKIEIYSITGRILKSINLDSANNEVDVSNLNPGVYILKTDDFKTHKFIKK